MRKVKGNVQGGERKENRERGRRTVRERKANSEREEGEQGGRGRGTVRERKGNREGEEGEQ